MDSNNTVSTIRSICNSTVDTLSESTEISSPVFHDSIFTFSYNPKHRSLVTWSHNITDILGAKDFSLIREGNFLLRYIHDEDRYSFTELIEKTIKDQTPLESTYRWIRPDSGETRRMLCRANMIKREDLLLEGFIIDLTTISAKAEDGPDNPQKIVSTLSDFTLVTDLDFIVMQASDTPSPCSFGLTNISHTSFNIGDSILEKFTKSFQSELRKECIKIVKGQKESFRAKFAEGANTFELAVLPILDSGVSSGFLFTLSDTSNLTELNNELSKLKERSLILDAISGTRQNLRNSLQIITAKASILKQQEKENTKIETTSDAILALASEAGELLQEQEKLERSSTETEKIDLNTQVLSVVRNLGDVKSRVSLQLEAIQPVNARASLFSEFLAKLFKTILSSKNSKIGVRTFQTSNNSQNLIACILLEIKLSENESNESLLETIPIKYEGLATEINATIKIKELSANGGSFTICIPLVSTKPSISLRKRFKMRSLEALVVDRDSETAEALAEMLCSNGLKSSGTAQVSETLGLLKRQNSIKLLILDPMSFPDSGKSILRRIRELRPDIAIIFTCSAKLQNGLASEFRAAEVLLKPVDLQVLKDSIERNLRAADS